MNQQTEIKQDPVRDEQRLTEISRLKLHENSVDSILDEYAEKAANEFGLPIGLVSVVLDEAQSFAASHGLQGWIKEANGTPVQWSFCANSVRSGEPFVVEDASQHEVVKDNPLVTHEGIKCYAGTPMVTKNGHVIGNFCVIGDKERTFTAEEIEKLKKFADQAVQRIEDRVK